VWCNRERGSKSRWRENRTPLFRVLSSPDLSVLHLCLAEDGERCKLLNKRSWRKCVSVKSIVRTSWWNQLEWDVYILKPCPCGGILLVLMRKMANKSYWVIFLWKYEITESFLWCGWVGLKGRIYRLSSIKINMSMECPHKMWKPNVCVCGKCPHKDCKTWTRLRCGKQSTVSRKKITINLMKHF